MVLSFKTYSASSSHPFYCNKECLHSYASIAAKTHAFPALANRVQGDRYGIRPVARDLSDYEWLSHQRIGVASSSSGDCADITHREWNGC
jgi:hypothetical protein